MCFLGSGERSRTRGGAVTVIQPEGIKEERKYPISAANVTTRGLYLDERKEEGLEG